MEHRGYTAHVWFDHQNKCFVGEVSGIRDVVMFEGETTKALEKSFIDAVDSYIDACEAEGIQPKKQCSGRFNLRLRPEEHWLLVAEAESRKISLNELVREKLFGG